MHNDTDASVLDEIASQQEKEWVGDGGQRKCNKESIQRFLCGMLYNPLHGYLWMSFFLSCLIHQIVGFSTKLSHTYIKNCFER